MPGHDRVARIAIIDGVRTPFAKRHTELRHLSALELATACVAELLHRSDQVVFGQVVPSMNGHNIARDVVLDAGLDPRTEAYSVARACATSYQSIARGVVFTSAKPDFCVGTDLKMLHDGRSAADGEAFARRTQAAFARIAKLDTTTVAAIAGRCLGGGLELALACDLRVASEDRSCQLGQTEVGFGLMPGAGATWRLP